MLEERFRIIYLSRDGTGIRQISLTWRKFVIIFSSFSILVLCIVGFSIGLFTRLYHNYRIIYLENDRQQLQKELMVIKDRVALLGNHLTEIETHGEELRTVASLPPINDDMRQMGVGGPSYAISLDYGFYPDEIHRSAAEIKEDLDKFEKIVQLEKYNQNEISRELADNHEKLRHLPSISPILGGRIISRFGYRTDPFTEKNQFHYGIDIPAPKGREILATADGTVEEVRMKYTPNQSYGREVIVDHGFGFKTRYAHCEDILVKKGDRVKRWDPIAIVGKTGRAEGYHLHYEVLIDRKQENPEYYIYN